MSEETRQTRVRTKDIKTEDRKVEIDGDQNTSRWLAGQQPKNKKEIDLDPKSDKISTGLRIKVVFLCTLKMCNRAVMQVKGDVQRHLLGYLHLKKVQN